MNPRALHLAFALAAIGTLLASTAMAKAPIKRFALIVGANDGGPHRDILRYATSDAQAIDKVLGEMGGLDSKNRMLLQNPDIDGLREGLETLGTRVAKAKTKDSRIELLFYYSGHSDEEGLLLGVQRFGYKELRDSIREIPADVHIAILDSCSSGVFTRTKGGRKRPPFMLDASSSVKGHAFLTSSSADEAAQESDRIGGSFFTHYLVTGLRGAADMTMDGKVTLNEAYQFAFYETLARTEKTLGGPQHPAYDIQLTGSGDLVLTDMRGTSSSLVFADEMYGKLFVHDAAGKLVAELRKPPGRPIELGLEPGVYRVVLHGGQELFGAEIVVGKGVRLKLSSDILKEVDREFAVARGNKPQPLHEGPAPVDNPLDDDIDRDEDGAMEAMPAPPMQSFVPPSLPVADPLADMEKELAFGRARVEAFKQQLKQEEQVTQQAEQHKRGQDKAEPLSYSVVPFSFTLAGRFGSNLNKKHVKVNGMALNLFSGRISALHGMQLGLIVNKVDFDMRGAQVTVIGNHAGKVHGGQFSAVYNRSSNDVTGAQFSSIFNTAGGDVTGIQGSSIYNMAVKLRGMQASGLINTVRDSMLGIQAAGLGNTTKMKATGLQVAGLFNKANGMKGLQASGLFNHSSTQTTGLQAAGLFNSSGDKTNGMQVAGLFNRAGDVRGMQAAGLFNKAGAVRGAQISVINVGGAVQGSQIGVVNVASTVSGSQIGVINVAKEYKKGVPVGLFNFVKGHLHIDVWYSEFERYNMALKFGNRYVYSILAFGMRDRTQNEHDRIQWSSYLGMGGRIPLGRRFYINLDGMVGNSHIGKEWGENLVLKARAIVGFSIFKRLSLFAGAQVTNIFAWDLNQFEQMATPSYGPAARCINGCKGVHDWWPGFVVGVQF